MSICEIHIMIFKQNYSYTIQGNVYLAQQCVLVWEHQNTMTMLLWGNVTHTPADQVV